MSWTRLPTHFSGRPIAFRIPYTMPGELIVTNNTQGVPFGDAAFLHNVDKPFEIHRMRVRLSMFDNATPPVRISPANLLQLVNADIQEVLSHYIRLRIADTSKNENLTKTQMMAALAAGRDSRDWEFEDPYTLVRSEGFQITVDNLAPATFALDGIAPVADATVGSILVELAFQGYLIVIAPPAETR